MTFTQSIRTCFAKYFAFSGRASRPEYWWFVLFLILASFVLGFVDRLLFGADDPMLAFRVVDEGTGPEGEGVSVGSSGGPLGSLFSLATIVPTLSAGWRRMHDTGRSGLYLLYPLIVMVGIVMFAGFLGGFEAWSAGNLGAVVTGGLGLVFLIAFCVFLISPLLVLWWLTRPSDPGRNSYGPPPPHVTDAHT